MRIALFGGTRGVGRQVLVQALEKDWGIKLLARHPDAVPPAPGLEVVGGDALDPGKVILTITGCDAVVSCLGPTKGSAPDVCSRWTDIILPAMQKFSLSRLVVISALGVGDSAGQIPLWMQPFFKTILKRSMQDKDRQEQLIRASGTDWTIIRPGGLTDRQTNGTAVVGTDVKQKAGMVGRAAVASLVINELETGRYRGRTAYIT